MDPLVILLAIVIYFFPALVAWQRRHHNTNAITVLNLFLGWTFVGWVASLIWASLALTQPVVITTPAAQRARRQGTQPLLA